MENYEELYIDEYFMQIARELENHNVLFYYFWDLGKPKFTEEIETACVTFDREGNFTSFLFNPNFWISCSHNKRKFVICHEILHVLFQHGKRMKGDDFHLNNIAMDITINHTLLRKFNFKKEELDGWEKFCFVETIFEDKNIPNDRNFEYYFSLLQDKNIKNNSEYFSTIDDHNKLENHEDSEEIMSGIGEKVESNFNEEEKKEWEEQLETEGLNKEFFENTEAGKGKGFFEYIFHKEKVAVKKKWESIIIKWVNNRKTNHYKDEESWLVQNKRFSAIKTDFSIPYLKDEEIITDKKDKNNLFFFQDVSGSCVHLIDRFFKAANSIPKERFNIRIFTFDTDVSEIDIKNPKIKIGGGTSFSIIEQYIQFIIKQEKIKYPDAVFIITDGYGNVVKPEKPQNWHWFLSSNYKKFIPNNSNSYNLKDFE